MGQCQTSVVVVGDNFVKAQSQHNNDIDIVSVAEFFHLANAEIQYVGKVNELTMLIISAAC